MGHFGRVELKISVEPLSEAEIKIAVGKLKSNKAAGVRVRVWLPI